MIMNVFRFLDMDMDKDMYMDTDMVINMATIYTQ